VGRCPRCASAVKSVRSDSGQVTSEGHTPEATPISRIVKAIFFGYVAIAVVAELIVIGIVHDPSGWGTILAMIILVLVGLPTSLIAMLLLGWLNMSNPIAWLSLAVLLNVGLSAFVYFNPPTMWKR
jgi:hypothetical protein